MPYIYVSRQGSGLALSHLPEWFRRCRVRCARARSMPSSASCRQSIIFGAASLMAESASSASTAPAPARKRKRGGGGWKANAVPFPEAAAREGGVAAPAASGPAGLPGDVFVEQEKVVDGVVWDAASFAEEWCKWPRMGAPIHGAPIIPMKCPLPASFDDVVADEHKFNAAMAVRYHRSKGVSIGMVVALVHCQARSHLTACAPISDQWTSNEELRRLGVTLCTLRLCATESFAKDDSKIIPSVDEVAAFCKVVSGYVERNPGQHVAVHCTSGFNCTGFMTVSYMVEVNNFSVHAALESFATSRPPGIYLPVWVRALLVRYDDATVKESEQAARRMLSNVNLPCWDTSPAPPTFTIPAASGGDVAPRVVFPKGDLPEARLVEDPVEQSKLRSTFQKLAALLGPDPFAAFTPLRFDDEGSAKRILQAAPLVTWRTLGFPVFFMIAGKSSFMITVDAVHELPNMSFPKRKNPNELLDGTLLVGDLVVDEVSGAGRTPRFLILDLIAFGGRPLLEQISIPKRLECARVEIVDPSRVCSHRLRLRVKSLVALSHAESIVTKIIPTLPHRHDGLLFVTSAGAGHARTTAPRVCEWIETSSTITRQAVLDLIRNISS